MDATEDEEDTPIEGGVCEGGGSRTPEDLALFAGAAAATGHG